MVDNESIKAENIRVIPYTCPEQLEAGKKKACYQLLPEPIEGVTVEFVELAPRGIVKQTLAIKAYSDRRDCPVNAIAVHKEETDKCEYKATDLHLQTIRMQFKLLVIKAATGIKFYWARAV